MSNCVCCGEVIPESYLACPNCLVVVKEKKTVKILVTKAPEGVYPEYQPEVGKIYEAEYVPAKSRTNACGNGWNWHKEFCVVDIKDKRIVLRNGEFAVIGGGEDG